jgi:NAD+ synthase (glutamine-hydrolysing)
VGNARKIADAATQAYAKGARLLLTPELSVCGYAAEDLFLRPAFISACTAAVQALAQELAALKGMVVVVGHPLSAKPQDAQNQPHQPYQAAPTDAADKADANAPHAQPALLWNAASALCEGQVVAQYAKQMLPNYQVFDERRYFTPGNASCVFSVGQAPHAVQVGLLICEDAWYDAPAQQAQQAGAQLLLVLNASPFHKGKGGEREAVMAQRVRATGLPLVYAHLVGGQDELVFDGRSFALDAQGQVVARAPAFEEALLEIDVEIGVERPANTAAPTTTPTTSPITASAPTSIATSVPSTASTTSTLAPLQPSAATGLQLRGTLAAMPSALAEIWHALVLGVRDYVGKNGFPGVLLGLSGGIDSALVLAVAVDALGPERVRAVMMPSPYTQDISWIDARAIAQSLHVAYEEISILPAFEAFKASLGQAFAGCAEDTAEENIQARIRGTLLMALSNKFGSIVLTTGNKSEMATGYCTLYGDMAGGFAVIKDLTKTQVFALARWRNAHDPCARGSNPIPERTISRPPSAELRPDQQDQDSLPPYAVLDAIVERYMENNESVAQLLAAGYLAEDVDKVTRLIKINEYKRRQAPLGIRLTHRGFGKDWRYPITNRFRA